MAAVQPNEQLQQTRTLIEGAKSFAIVLEPNPSLDSVATALALYLSLSAVGKQASVACPSSMTVGFSHLVGVDKVGSTISSGEGRNLIVSFPYQEGSIEKVSYNIAGEAFNLVIEPREGYPLITPDVIRYNYGGGAVDTIITVNITQLTDLQGLYQANQAVFAEKPIINIDTHANNTGFGRVNLVNPNVSSISELAVAIMSQVGLPIDADTASNLLAGISDGSQNYTSPQTSASTFEAAAICLRTGGRQPAPTLPQQQVPQQMPPRPAQAAPVRQPYTPPPTPPAQPYAQPVQQPYAQPAPQPYAQPVQQPYAQPAPQPYAQPVQQPYAQPAPQQQPPIRQPMPQPQPQAAPLRQPYTPPPTQAPQPQQQPLRGPANSPQQQQQQRAQQQQQRQQQQQPARQQYQQQAPAAPAPQQQQATSTQQQQDAPSDWLKPKIYKGTSTV